MKLQALNTQNGRLGFISDEYSQSSYGLPIFYDIRGNIQCGSAEVGKLVILEPVTSKDVEWAARVFELLPVPQELLGPRLDDEEFEKLEGKQ